VRVLRDAGKSQRLIASELGVTFGRVQDSWQRLEGEDRALVFSAEQAYAEAARRQFLGLITREDIDAILRAARTMP
jgi:hypothetical protein